TLNSRRRHRRRADIMRTSLQGRAPQSTAANPFLKSSATYRAFRYCLGLGKHLESPCSGAHTLGSPFLADSVEIRPPREPLADGSKIARFGRYYVQTRRLPPERIGFQRRQRFFVRNSAVGLFNRSAESRLPPRTATGTSSYVQSQPSAR